MALTGLDVAKSLGLSESGVSRLRSGGRMPSYQTMAKVAEVFGWPIDSQVVHRMNGTWGEQFNKQIEFATPDAVPAS